MKSFSKFVNEAKLSYEQQWELHRSEIDLLKKNGYEVWSSNSEMRDKPGHSSYGYEKRVGMKSPRFEIREMQLHIFFHHNKFTRVNSNVRTVIQFVDGANENTGSPRKVDEKNHKNIQAAIKYLKKAGIEKVIESMSYVFLAMNARPIEELKKNYIINNLYVFRRFINVNNEQEAVKFVEKIKKADLNSLQKASAFAKKFVKDI